MKFGMLMYLGHLKKSLDFGYGLLIFLIWAKFWFNERRNETNVMFTNVILTIIRRNNHNHGMMMSQVWNPDQYFLIKRGRNQCQVVCMRVIFTTLCIEFCQWYHRLVLGPFAGPVPSLMPYFPYISPRCASSLPPTHMLRLAGSAVRCQESTVPAFTHTNLPFCAPQLGLRHVIALQVLGLFSWGFRSASFPNRYQAEITSGSMCTLATAAQTRTVDTGPQLTPQAGAHTAASGWQMWRQKQLYYLTTVVWKCFGETK